MRNKNINDTPFFIEGPGPVSCLLLHGFAGTASQMRPFAQYLHAQEFTCFAPVLAGHGTLSSDLFKVTAEDWLFSGEQGYLELEKHKKPIIAIGHSMGGAISLYLAAKYPVCALILMATPTYMWPGAKTMISFLGEFSPILASPHFALLHAGNDNTVEGYPDAPAVSILEFLRTLDLVRPHIRKVASPTLIFQPYLDYVVPFTNAKKIKSLLSSQIIKIHYLKKTLHLPHLDQESEFVFSQTASFLAAHVLKKQVRR